jgi:transketolase
VAIGCALSAKRQGRSSRYYVILGDGEMQEGQIWEAAMLAGAKGLDNLCLIVDYNFVQSEGSMDKVMSLEPLLTKMTSFNFSCLEVDGNDIAALLNAYAKARETKNKPTFIKANTVMGKGVPSLEGLMFHQLRFPEEVARSARTELEAQI